MNPARTSALHGAAAGPSLPRRVWLTRSVAALAAAAGTPAISAGAAATARPAAVTALDTASMALFDAAEAADWGRAEAALQLADTAAAGIASTQAAYVDAGGGLDHFYAATNNLSADLIEAATALSVHDFRWLVGAADRIVARAGELTQPFVDLAGDQGPQIETLLFLIRRMRRALVWHDDGGLRDARDAFERIWSLRRDRRQQPLRLAVVETQVDSALVRIGAAPSLKDLQSLYASVLELRPDAAVR